jgi:hypothetical protein
MGILSYSDPNSEEYFLDIPIDNEKITVKLEEMTIFASECMYELGSSMTFRAKEGRGGFTDKGLLDNILLFEKRYRKDTEWFGLIDIHHICFERLELKADGRFSLFWGPYR